ncbi:hypothetical protein ACQ4M3_33795 [Leptolyngbya sp. AN03gr2]|uniref:hypothetical protein n=1 Tax=Leptolyngbya sp. AN10 TaxID=3423365 RepID=UPI003D324131
MVTRIKVNKLEFEAAETDGCVYGKDFGRRHGSSGSSAAYSVYVELGTRKRYISRESDDTNLKFKLFKNCVVYYARSDDEADREEFAFSESIKTVIIYCDA